MVDLLVGHRLGLLVYCSHQEMKCRETLNNHEDEEKKKNVSVCDQYLIDLLNVI